ncbi:NPCBM/NEW2 domain-containing protein [Streptomyces sp. NPDC004134]|uniref:NPCBM/NEW2 domain-containing protein n=1 Tax=Streptomyces sp. NPDC004134 TaxID=3364691 RepID=UPI0036B92964
MRKLPSARRAARPYARAVIGAAGAVALCAVLTAPVAAAPTGAQTQSATAAAKPAARPGAQPAVQPGAQPAVRLPDGLAKTPPMGFNNWNSTHCRAEFDHEMVKGIADIFVERGLKDAGYEYVNLDDCWALPQRDANGKLVPDPVRFPDGIKAVADYVHSKGLKIGIYTSAGTKTCNSAGFPGALGHEESDAMQFAEWGIDYLKYDNCNNQGVDAIQRYTKMRDALKAASETTGRPIVYSICEWGQNKPWEWAADVGHLWRTTGDISDNWSSMLGIMKQNLPLAEYAGPGRWNDPDMLEVGNGGMTDTEYRTHFSMWSIMAAPLLIGSDLRTADEATFDILENRDVIAVDQDPLGKQGAVVTSEGGRWVVAKEMADGSRAVALFNESNAPQRISTTAEAVGLPAAEGYRMRDLWQHADYNTGGEISASVPAHGTVMYRVWPGDGAGSYPPAAEFGTDATPYVEAGEAAEVTTTFRNTGITPAKNVTVAFDAPEGWQVETGSPTTAKQLKPGAELTTTWQVTAPAGADTGRQEFPLSAGYAAPSGQKVSLTSAGAAYVVASPPAGTTYASDWEWLEAGNGWGPVERDTSVGEQPAGDGKPLTIGGRTYAKGLGVHAASDVGFYTGEECETFSAQVGVDDETGTNGSVSFEVWADGARVADSGVLTGDKAAQPLSADIGDAQTVRLVVTDGGDGVNHDHGDWADAKFTC